MDATFYHDIALGQRIGTTAGMDHAASSRSDFVGGVVLETPSRRPALTASRAGRFEPGKVKADLIPVNLG